MSSEHAEVDRALGAQHVDEREHALVAVEHPHDLSRDSEAHVSSPPFVVQGRDPLGEHRVDLGDRLRDRRLHRLGQADPLVDVERPCTPRRTSAAVARRGRPGWPARRPGPSRADRSRPSPRSASPTCDRAHGARPAAARQGVDDAPVRRSRRAGRRPGACRGCRSRPRAPPRAGIRTRRSAGRPRDRTRRRRRRGCRCRPAAPGSGLVLRPSGARVRVPDLSSPARGPVRSRERLRRAARRPVSHPRRSPGRRGSAPSTGLPAPPVRAPSLTASSASSMSADSLRPS